MSNREKPTHLPESVDVVSLRLLSDALRKEMPEHFQWNYCYADTKTDCGTVGCALGLAKAIGLKGSWGRDFGLASDIHMEIFFRTHVYHAKRMDEVTPTDVADAIDFYLDHGRLP